jgi:opacity protein-like surface antigen
MGSFKHYALAGLVALMAPAAAHAADLPAPAPYAPIEVGGGWYLRGDIGITNQDVDRLSFVPREEAILRGVGDDSFESIHSDFDSSPLVGLGIGYQFNHWIRADITGEYRGKATFHGLERAIDLSGANDYTATKSEWVGLANVYFDLGTWYSLTPFIGAGVGFTHTMIDNFRDMGAPSALAFARDHSETDLAWALHAGVAYDVTPNFKVEFAYRYLNLGDGQTGILHRYDDSGCRCLAVKFKDLDSHDFKVGMRWMLGAPVLAAANEPVIRKY